MVNIRIVIVVASLIFSLFWLGLLQAILRNIISLIPFPYDYFRIHYVESVRPQEPQVEGDVAFEKTLEENERQMHAQLMDVVNIMEDLASSSEMDGMSDEEIEVTFGHLYDVFPVMDKLFEEVLQDEYGISSINPGADYYETHRRYLAMRKVLEEKRRAKEAIKSGDSGISDNSSSDVTSAAEEP
ncbi:uncharacterized protein LOC135224171 [Macrobrachium nipponense]|uniref:uncharacterized protein LOC135224171 n=1 Tax=Macrobrachium nipponense TaxID=159736 RepID=UPI0030C7E075